MAYWILAILVTAFGVLTGFSIGLPILLFGVTLLALGPFRARPTVFWPVFLGVFGFVLTFMAIAPYLCTGTMGLGEGSTPASTVCTSLIGIRYETVGLANPSALPALLLGLAVGVVGGLATFFVLSRRVSPGT